jgi:hypothetical protein
MRKVQLLGIALVVLCAFSGFIAASAFATAEWLANGNPIAAPSNTETGGELAFFNEERKAGFLCSGVFGGTVGAGGADSITDVLNLALVEIKELDESGATGGVSCVSDGNTCENGSEIWPVKLPFKTSLELRETGGVNEYYDKIEKAEYFVLCLAVGGLVDETELCESATGAAGKVVNVAGGVEPTGSVEPLGTCNGHAGVGLITADAGGLITLTNGEALTVSG